jgi:molybdate transport system regulatory protein
MTTPQTDNEDRTAGRPELQVKLLLGGGAIGPGQIALLEKIDEAGSISAAARQMGLSFRRAWQLIDTLNALMPGPAVATRRGGSKGGSAHLTELGEELVTRYTALMSALDGTAAPFLAWLSDTAGSRIAGTKPSPAAGTSHSTTN